MRLPRLFQMHLKPDEQGPHFPACVWPCPVSCVLRGALLYHPRALLQHSLLLQAAQFPTCGEQKYLSLVTFGFQLSLGNSEFPSPFEALSIFVTAPAFPGQQAGTLPEFWQRFCVSLLFLGADSHLSPGRSDQRLCEARRKRLRLRVWLRPGRRAGA